MTEQNDNTFQTDFLLNPDIIFLNHGSFGATPRPVFEAYQDWQRKLEWQPVEFLGRQAGEYLAAARTSLASYLGTQRDNLVFVTNATIGLNTVARSLNLSTTDEILASDHEYGALDRTWKFLSQKSGFTYRNVPIPLPITDKKRFIESFWRQVNKNTRVIFLSHITSPTAIIFPVKEICAQAREAGILTVIDGAHAPGQIPLALDELGADFYSGNLHKWLCAPKGTAFLYARPEVQHLIEPLVISWGWQSDTPSPSTFVDYLEWQGTRDISSFLTVPDAIRYQQIHHWSEVWRASHDLCQFVRRELTNFTGLEPLCPDSSEWYAQMATSQLPVKCDVANLKIALYERFHIEVPVHEWNGRKLIRYSFQAYNQQADAEKLVEAVKALI